MIISVFVLFVMVVIRSSVSHGVASFKVFSGNIEMHPVLEGIESQACAGASPCWLGSGSSWLFLTERSSGPSWSAMRSLLRTGFCAVAAAVPPPAPLLAPVPLLQAEAEVAAAAAAELGLRAEPGVGDGEEEEADDGGELGAGGKGPGGEHGAGARDTTLGRLWSFMMPLGRGESS